MTDDDWLAFQYRDFYDVPRVFIVDFHGGRYLFDCPFDDDRDEYPDEYIVYRIADPLPDNLSETDWCKLATTGKLFGRVRVRDVNFDSSKRNGISALTFERIRAEL